MYSIVAPRYKHSSTKEHSPRPGAALPIVFSNLSRPGGGADHSVDPSVFHLPLLIFSYFSGLVQPIMLSVMGQLKVGGLNVDFYFHLFAFLRFK